MRPNILQKNKHFGGLTSLLQKHSAIYSNFAFVRLVRGSDLMAGGIRGIVYAQELCPQQLQKMDTDAHACYPACASQHKRGTLT